MSSFVLLFRELLGAVRLRSGVQLLLSGASILVFLGAVSLLLLSDTAVGSDSTSYANNQILVVLSPQLSSSTVDALYLQIRERVDVRNVQLRFAEQVQPGDTGLRLLIDATSPNAVDGLRGELLAVAGVARVEGQTAGEETLQGIALPGALRLSLLAVLLLSVVGSLFFARQGFRGLLRSFSREIRLLRLSGVSERTVAWPVVVLGVSIGLLSTLVLLVVWVLVHVTAAGSSPGFLGAIAWGTVAQVGALCVVLGLALGGLVGLLGASIVSGREFSPFA